ncbi:MAG: MBL fold metallo-hydrolase [Candidatus Wildermuthbacteria bacterium]|nr:MBL fold metallo-hydrolase [Candidatus Wildermuthbacteria bacterium]
MQVIWKGQACFQLLISRAKEEPLKIVIDPYAGSFTGLRELSLDADIALFTHDHADHNNAKALRQAQGKPPFVIANPGEYEVQGVFIKGIPSYHDQSEGKERGLNTIYCIEGEDIQVCHLGDLGQKELTSQQLELIGDVDILLIPVGGVYTIDAKGAVGIVHQLEPRIVIPMHYAIPKLKFTLAGPEEFLKAMGAKGVQPQEKLTVKAKDLSGEETQVVVLSP